MNKITLGTASNSQAAGQQDAAWDLMVERTCHALPCSREELLDAVHHTVTTGSSAGGPQSFFYEEMLSHVDWKRFWEVYNEAHNANVEWDEDPFCC